MGNLLISKIKQNINNNSCADIYGNHTAQHHLPKNKQSDKRNALLAFWGQNEPKVCHLNFISLFGIHVWMALINATDTCDKQRAMQKLSVLIECHSQ